MRRFVGAAAAALLCVMGLALAGGSPAGAEVACGSFSSTAGRCVNTQLSVAGTSYNVDWYLPNAPASGLVLLQQRSVPLVQVRVKLPHLVEHGLQRERRGRVEVEGHLGDDQALKDGVVERGPALSLATVSVEGDDVQHHASSRLEVAGGHAP